MIIDLGTSLKSTVIDNDILKLARDVLHSPVLRMKWDNSLDEIRVIDSTQPSLMCVYQKNKSPGGP